MIKIIDKTKAITTSYFKLVFFRKTSYSKSITLIDWIRLAIFEIFFGEELLEQFSLTSSYNNLSEHQKTGQMLHLNDMVPSGLLTNFFRNEILNVLYFKYYKNYLFLDSEVTVEEKGDDLDLTCVRFAMKHDALYQVIALRRVYVLSWFFLNLFSDLIIYLSVDLQSAILSALCIEAFRRICRV